MTERKLNRSIATLAGLKYVGDGRCINPDGSFFDLPDYCNNWNDLIPLVDKHCLKYETFKRGAHRLVSMVNSNNTERFVTRAKTLERATAECLLKVLPNN